MENNSRRNFIKTAAVAAAGITIVPRHVLGGTGYRAPSDMLQVASIGVGGMGGSDVNNILGSGKANIAFLCDVDKARAKGSVEKFRKAKIYTGAREMLDKGHKNIDAVSVSTPDQNDAIQPLAAFQLGKHVYVQKPLGHDVWGPRALTPAARRY